MSMPSNEARGLAAPEAALRDHAGPAPRAVVLVSCTFYYAANFLTNKLYDQFSGLHNDPLSGAQHQQGNKGRLIVCECSCSCQTSICGCLINKRSPGVNYGRNFKGVIQRLPHFIL